MNVKVYCRRTNGKLHKFDATNVTSAAGAIALVQYELDAAKEAYSSPILCLIQGGKD